MFNPDHRVARDTSGRFVVSRGGRNCLMLLELVGLFVVELFNFSKLLVCAPLQLGMCPGVLRQTYGAGFNGCIITAGNGRTSN